MKMQETIARFLDGETTVEEEQALCRRFREGNVPPELAPYAEFFLDMATLPVTEKPIRRSFILHRWVAAAAVVAAFVVGGAWLQRRLDYQLLAQTYGGSYVIVEGKRIDNLAKIKDEVGALLADADCIETHAKSQQVINDVEQDVLQSVPANKRKEIERLLNE